MPTNEHERLFLNGEFMPLSEGRVPVEDRGFQFADGIYESLRTLNGRIFRLYPHLQRLRRSAEGLMLRLEYNEAAMAEILTELVAQAGLDEGTIYVQITRGVAPRAHVLHGPAPRPTTLAYTRVVPRVSAEAFEMGARAISIADDRWGHCNYKTIALLANVLGKMKAEAAGGDEALYYDGATRAVYECGSANAFAVIGGIAYTHPNGPKILDGITRRAILEACAREDIPCIEQARTLDDYRTADELFLSSTTRDVFPIVELDGRKIGEGRPGPLTRKINNAYLRLLDSETGAGRPDGKER